MYIAESGECKPCNDECKTCHGSTATCVRCRDDDDIWINNSCQPCPTGQYIYHNEYPEPSHCQNACAEGEFLEETECKDCADNCKICTDTTECVTCDDEYTLLSNG
jgi:hypothetical protein